MSKPTQRTAKTPGRATERAPPEGARAQHAEVQTVAIIQSNPPNAHNPLPTLDQIHVNLANGKLQSATRILQAATLLISEAYCAAPEPLSLKIADILTSQAQTEQMLKESIT